MSGVLRLQSIVEGHGEVEAVPILIRRIVAAIDAREWIQVEKPIRVPRGTLLRAGELERYVEYAGRVVSEVGAVLVLVDADDDCPAELGPALLARVNTVRPAVRKAVVIANREYEAWLLAGAESMAARRGLPSDLRAPADPEGVRDAKGWIQDRRTDGLAYTPTADQPALTAVLDVELVRRRSPSFDKLWREIERLLRSPAAPDGCR